MGKYVNAALLANSITIGVHWIYDPQYLKKLSKKQSLLFMRQEKEHFDKSKASFYAYPKQGPGDFTVQGDILKWLDQALEDKIDLSVDEYHQILIDAFKPGGTYEGYTEKYIKEDIFNYLSKELRKDYDLDEVNDNQMVGFVPYIACKDHGLSNERAFEYCQIYSNLSIFKDMFSFFDLLMAHMNTKSIKKAIEKVLIDTPDGFKEAFTKAIEMEDTDAFIDQYAGRACPIKHALPVIIHLLYHTSSFEEALEKNALIGGASADRALLLGALLSEKYEINKDWMNHI
jgi:hypothetical protein